MERMDYDNHSDYYMCEIIRLFLDRYNYVFKHLYGQRVLDAGCGTGLGTFIYSLVAREILAVDYSAEAIAKAQKLSHQCPVTFIQADLNTVDLAETDVCVAIEVLEHLQPGNTFLERLRAQTLIFSLPLENPGPYHLISFKTRRDIINYLADHGWTVTESMVMRGDNAIGRANASVIGLAQRIKK